MELKAFRKSAARNTDDRREKGSGNDPPLDAYVLIGTHNRSTKNIIQGEIDGFPKMIRG
jgi:hypothetical protein